MEYLKVNESEILQLPDHVFGARFVVACELRVGGDSIEWEMSEIALPEKFVLWQLSIMWQHWSIASSYLRIGMGDQLPTATVMMDTCEPLVPGLGEAGTYPRGLHGYQYTGHERINMRMARHAMGRRMVIEVNSAAAATSNVRVAAVVSSIPDMVPKCVLSV